MFKKTVYFRTQEDLDKFNAIKNKAEWLHFGLISNIGYDLNQKVEETFGGGPSFDGLGAIVDDRTIVTKQPEKVVKTNFPTISPQKEAKFCKHNFQLGFCKKGCK